MAINRQRPDQTFWQLYQSHREFLRKNGVQADTIDRLEQNEIDQFHAEALEVEIEALYSEMVNLEGRLDGLHGALMMAAEMAERSHSAQ